MMLTVPMCARGWLLVSPSSFLSPCRVWGWQGGDISSTSGLPRASHEFTTSSPSVNPMWNWETISYTNWETFSCNTQIGKHSASISNRKTFSCDTQIGVENIQLWYPNWSGKHSVVIPKLEWKTFSCDIQIGVENIQLWYPNWSGKHSVAIPKFEWKTFSCDTQIGVENIQLWYPNWSGKHSVLITKLGNQQL